MHENITGQTVDAVLGCGNQCPYNGFQLWDIIDKSVVSNCICLSGVVSNFMTLIVIIRQGFSDAINVSLLGLTISDIGLLISLSIYNTIGNPLMIAYVDTPYNPNDICIFPLGHLRYYFSRTTCYITIFIIVQRCLCIALPFKIKSILAPKRSGVIIVSIFIGTYFLNMFPHTSTGDIHLGWIFSPAKNKTLFGSIITEKWLSLYNLSSFIAGVSQMTSFIIIVLFTAILIIQLKQKTKWRESSGAVASDKAKSVSKRDHKLGVMVAVLSGIFIVCYIPSTGGLILILCFPSVANVSAPSAEMSFAWALGNLFEAMNSSANIFVYYKTSSKYRRTFDSVICMCMKDRNNSK